MASASPAASFWCVFVVISPLWFGCFHQASAYAPLLEMSCRGYLDLKGGTAFDTGNDYDAGIVESRLPSRIGPIVDEHDVCDIRLVIPSGYGMMFYFIYLDLQSDDNVNCDTARVEFFDSAVTQYVPELQKPLCGGEREMPKGRYFVRNNVLLIRVSSDQEIRGRGFKIHFTIYRTTLPCGSEEFTCETHGPRRCIADHLLCDDWDDCGDAVDEDYWCNYIKAAGITAIVLSAIILTAIIIGVYVCCKRRKEQMLLREDEKEMEMMRHDTSMDSSRGEFDPPFTVSNEVHDKERQYYYDNSRNNHSGRRSRSGSHISNRDADYNDREDDRPPPYSEKSFDTRSVGQGSFTYEKGEPRRARHRSRSRERSTAHEGVDEEVPRGRRRRSRSREGRTAPAAEEDRYSGDSMDDDRYDDRHDERRREPRDKDDRYPPRDNRHSPREGRRGRRSTDRNERYADRDDRNERYADRDDQYGDEDNRYSDRGDHYPETNDRYPERDDLNRDRDDRYPERDGRYPKRDDRYTERDDRYPERDDRYPERDDRYPERDDRYPERDDRYPERDHRHPKRDRRNPQRNDRYPERDDRYPERDDRYPYRDKEDSDSRLSRESDRDRDHRPRRHDTTEGERDREGESDRSSRDSRRPDQEDDRAQVQDGRTDRDRDRHKDRRTHKERPRSSRRDPDDSNSNPGKDPHRPRDHHSSRDDRNALLPEDQPEPYTPPSNERKRNRGQKDRAPEARDERRERKEDNSNDDYEPYSFSPPPQSASGDGAGREGHPRNERPAGGPAGRPRGNYNQSPPDPDIQDNSSRQEDQSPRRRRRPRAESRDSPPPAEVDAGGDVTPPRRRRRRRSRSREDQERPQSSRYGEGEEGRGKGEEKPVRGRRSRSGVLPVDQPGYKEQSV